MVATQIRMYSVHKISVLTTGSCHGVHHQREGWSPLVHFVRKWRMENETSSSDVWKRNCCTCAVEPATVVPVSLLSVHAATLRLWFCSTGSSDSSVLFLFSLLFSELKELSVSQSVFCPKTWNICQWYR